MKKYTQKEIDKVVNLSIVSVVESLGYPLKKTGRTYSSGKNNKLRVFPDSNSYYNFSTGQGGNTINFVQHHLDTTFNKSMEYLLNGNYEETKFSELPKKEFHYYFPHNSDTSVGKDYLINKRKLDSTLINFLFDKQKIRMDKLNQIIFPWQKNNVIVGATVQGTTYDPKKYDHGYFKGIARDSESNFVYSISIGKPNKVYVFESPIDMLSYWSMNKHIKNATFASANGAKDQSVYKLLGYLEQNNCKIKDIYVGSDNDRTGQIFFQKLDRDYKYIEIHNIIPDDLMIPNECISIYKEMLVKKQSNIDIELLAAIHKAETNLTMTNECTSKEELVFYFGKRLNRADKEKPSLYTQGEVKERVGKLIDDLEDTRVGNHISIKKALEKRLEITLPSEDISNDFLKRVDYYLKSYKNLDDLLIGLPVKDWNDKQKEKIEKLEEIKNTNKFNEKTNEENRSQIKSHEQKDNSAVVIEKTFVNQERKQKIKISGVNELVKADIFQTGQYAGSLEPSSLEEMEKLVSSYGFMAIDKEDYVKYTEEKKQDNMIQDSEIFIR